MVAGRGMGTGDEGEARIVNAVDQIFAEAERSWMQFELPIPPSVNRFMKKLGNKSPNVRAWIRQADIAYMVAQIPFKRKIEGKFEAEYIFGQHRGDLSNRIKPLEDWLQSREFIENDRLCQSFRCAWDASGVPAGRVLVRLRPWVTA